MAELARLADVLRLKFELCGGGHFRLDIVLALLLLLPMVLQRPEHVPGLVPEAVVEELNHLLVEPRVEDRFRLHRVHEAEEGSDPFFVRVLLGVRLHVDDAARVVPAAPPLRIALVEVAAHVARRLVQQVAHEEELALNCYIWSNFLFLGAVAGILEQPDLHERADDHVVDAPSVEHVAAFCLLPDLLLEGGNAIVLRGDLLLEVGDDVLALDQTLDGLAVVDACRASLVVCGADIGVVVGLGAVHIDDRWPLLICNSRAVHRQWTRRRFAKRCGFAKRGAPPQVADSRSV